VARSLATTRAHLEVRAAVVARTRAELLPRLAALCGVGPVASARPGEARLALLFTGQGSQRAGMGRELATSFPAFREALDEVVAGFAAHLPRSLREVMFAEVSSDAAALLAQTAFTQPALFALEVALYRLGESFGLRPELLLGHSIGELAAAYVAGVFSLSDACALVAARGRLMQDLPPGGVMVSLEASEAELLPLLLDRAGELDLAALNGPWSTVISGEEDAVFAVARAMEARGRKATRLGVSHAFHSPRMEPMLAELRRLACRLRFRPPQIQIVSSVTGRRASAEELCSPDYWVKQARQPVRFLDAMRVLGSEGITTYLELGPQGVLAALGQECLSQDVRESAAFLPALRRDGSEAAALVTAMGGLHVRGHALDWAAYFATSGARRVTLPTYPFQRQRYWLSATPRSSARAAEETAEAMLRRLLGQGALSAAARAALPEILTALSTGRDAVARADVAGWFHQLQWRPVSLGVAHGDGEWLILDAGDAGDGGDAAAVATALRRCGGTVATRSLTADADPAAGDDLLSGALRGVVFLAGSGAGAPARFLKVL
ncbi:MAG TPA: acyltransferase domain-containing protein, partial [Pseudomonadota bacterium]|nr:acyltransferase domain-containing protein [Pseudomonadota bacterium]